VNHLGSVRDVIDGDEIVRVHRTFDAFGNVTSEQLRDGSNQVVQAGQPGALLELLGFTGKPFDPDTGLQNNLYRWYEAAVGRWVSEDPVGFDGRALNLFRYAANAPTSGFDVFGLLTQEGQAAVKFIHANRFWLTALNSPSQTLERAGYILQDNKTGSLSILRVVLTHQPNTRIDFYRRETLPIKGKNYAPKPTRRGGVIDVYHHLLRRVWTHVDGRETIDAELVSYNSRAATVDLDVYARNGRPLPAKRRISAPMSSLSREDRAFIPLLEEARRYLNAHPSEKRGRQPDLAVHGPQWTPDTTRFIRFGWHTHPRGTYPRPSLAMNKDRGLAINDNRVEIVVGDCSGKGIYVHGDPAPENTFLGLVIHIVDTDGKVYLVKLDGTAFEVEHDGTRYHDDQG